MKSSELSIIEQVVSYYRHDECETTKMGDGFKICCPFHGEKSPSNWVQPEKEMFYCFGCNEGGSAIDYIILQEEYLPENFDRLSESEQKRLNSEAYRKAKNKLATILESESEKIDELLIKRERIVSVKEVKPLSKDVLREFTKDKSELPEIYRGIRKETFQYFGHLFKLNQKGEVVAEWYPETMEFTSPTGAKGSVIVGYKCRNFPKNFTRGKIGTTGASSQFSGQHKCKGSRNFLLIVGGELDKCAAHQMFQDVMNTKYGDTDNYEGTHVVSVTAGEGSLKKQIENNLEFVMSYNTVYFGLDNDAAGKKAVKEAIESLPSEFRHKIKIISWSGENVKDPNDMLKQGKIRQFTSDFWNAKDYIPDGIKSSVDASNGIVDLLLRPRIPIPDWFPKKAISMLRGYIPLGVIVNIVADTSIGKTTFVRQLVDYWLKKSPYKCGIISLEETAEQYHLGMLSYRIKKDLTNFDDPEEAVVYFNSPFVQKANEELMTDDEGKPRYQLIDDRDGTSAAIILQCEILIRKYGCKLLIIDPIQDLTDGMPLEEQQKLIKWQKNIVKDGVTIVNVCHIRKNVGGKTVDKDGKRIARKVVGDDIQGSSTISKSGAITIILERDKHHEEEIEKNSTYMSLDKNRHGKQTGDAGAMYYTGTELLCRETYFEQQSFGQEEISYEKPVANIKNDVILVESNDIQKTEVVEETISSPLVEQIEESQVEGDSDCPFDI